MRELKEFAGADVKHVDDVLALSSGFLVKDCKCLYEALERIQTSGLNLSGKRTSVEVLASRQRIRQLDFKTIWVNSDREQAESLTKLEGARWGVYMTTNLCLE